MAKKSSKLLEQLQQKWLNAWPQALAAWSRFTKLHEPHWCFTQKDEKREQLSGSFAMIRLLDHAIVISLRLIEQYQLQDFALEILAHEIGHHVYTPADLNDNAILITRIRAGLPTQEKHAGFIANLYTDLLINDRLQRSAEMNIAGVYKTLLEDNEDSLWTLYMRIYELLWNLPPKTLATGQITPEINVDAQLGARLIRVYSKEWLRGAGRFAVLCLPYLLKMKGSKEQMIPLLDAISAGVGDEIPDGLAQIDLEELEGAIHPALDPLLGGVETIKTEKTSPQAGDGNRNIRGGKKNNYRSPQEYEELIKSLGVKISPSEIAIRYYRERALPYLIPFPKRRLPESKDPLLEGTENWDIGSPMGNVDWLETVIRSPRIIPGITTLQRVFGTTAGGDPQHRPMDLYIGIDCSGSMPNPRMQLSFPVIAATIMAISALRAGARVMAVLSGESPGRYTGTNGFTNNEHHILEVLTDYLGTGYAFGIKRLEQTFLKEKRHIRKTHILIITDHDIFSMLDRTPKGWEIAREALEEGGSGGTYVLHEVPSGYRGIKKMKEDGWDVSTLREWQSLVEFARSFSRKKYEDS